MARKTFTANELDQLEDVVFHLQMLEYGLGFSYSPLRERFGLASPVPRYFFMFATAHLVDTLFLVDRGKRVSGGYCYTVLSRLRLAAGLQPIRRTLARRVGTTSFGEFIRNSRNKLMVHGDLSFGSLPVEAQAVPYDALALRQFARASDNLTAQVTHLRGKLQDIARGARENIKGEPSLTPG